MSAVERRGDGQAGQDGPARRGWARRLTALTAADIVFTDVDVQDDRPASVKIETLPAAGTLTQSGAPVDGANEADIADETDLGNLTYTLAAADLGKKVTPTRP